jgi:hypothetical protein
MRITVEGMESLGPRNGDSTRLATSYCRVIFSSEMDPDVFITIVYSTFVFLAAAATIGVVTVRLMRSHRRGAFSPDLPVREVERVVRQPSAKQARQTSGGRIDR